MYFIGIFSLVDIILFRTCTNYGPLIVSIYLFLFFFSDDLDSVITGASIPMSERLHMFDDLQFPSKDMDVDDRESIQSGLATLPDSSYAGFERIQPPSSTPNRPQVTLVHRFVPMDNLSEKNSSYTIGITVTHFNLSDT